MNRTAEALRRTTLLVNEQYFGVAGSELAIAKGLLSTTVRLRADEANLRCRAGQAALVTAFSLIARMGVGIDLAIADVEVIDPVAPLRESGLGGALHDLGHDIVPNATVRSGVGEVDLTIAFGDTPCHDARAVRVFADELSCAIVGGGTPARRITADCR